MPPTDQTTTIQDLKEMLKAFRDARDWGKFHTPKNLTQAISIEANALMEEFLWKTDEEITALLRDPQLRERVSHELADVLAFCLNFANETGIDVSRAMTEKMRLNEAKYPVEKSKGNAAKYTEL